MRCSSNSAGAGPVVGEGPCPRAAASTFRFQSCSENRLIPNFRAAAAMPCLAAYSSASAFCDGVYLRATLLGFFSPFTADSLSCSFLESLATTASSTSTSETPPDVESSPKPTIACSRTLSFFCAWLKFHHYTDTVPRGIPTRVAVAEGPNLLHSSMASARCSAV